MFCNLGPLQYTHGHRNLQDILVGNTFFVFDIFCLIRFFVFLRYDVLPTFSKIICSKVNYLQGVSENIPPIFVSENNPPISDSTFVCIDCHTTKSCVSVYFKAKLRFPASKKCKNDDSL